tara:strand:+ start:189 stop:995 length:807 start_codon:yes stop_codon:yes gene_type:complete
MEITKLKVTPSIAQEWLDTENDINRPISKRNVNKFANDLRAGRWRETHQNIIAFFEDGKLADGQHRLLAIVAANMPFELMIATGLERSAGSMIDQGRPRSVSDALRIGGLLSSDKYTGYAVAIVKMILSAEVTNNKTLSISETAQFIEVLRDGIEFVCGATSAIQGSGIKNAVVRAAITTGYYSIDKPKLERFVRVLVSGMPEGPDDAIIIRLRNWLLIEGSNGGGSARVVRYRTILKILKAYNDGEDKKIIRRANENAFILGIFADE